MLKKMKNKKKVISQNVNWETLTNQLRKLFYLDKKYQVKDLIKLILSTNIPGRNKFNWDGIGLYII